VKKRIIHSLIFGGFFVFALGLFILGGTTTAQAHDGSDTQTFDTLDPLTTNHYDQDPWKGWFNLTVTNNTNVAWGDFHFSLIDIPGQPSSNVVFCDSSTSGCNDPISSQTMTYAIGNGGKTLDLFFYGDPVSIGNLATFNVYTDNRSNQNPFALSYYPTVVPEPVSSTLFILGGATLGLRRFWKKRANA
jgi:hypothetical protein